MIFQHEFIRKAKTCAVLQKMLTEAREIQEAQAIQQENENDSVGTVNKELTPSFAKLSKLYMVRRASGYHLDPHTLKRSSLITMKPYSKDFNLKHIIWSFSTSI